MKFSDMTKGLKFRHNLLDSVIYTVEEAWDHGYY